MPSTSFKLNLHLSPLDSSYSQLPAGPRHDALHFAWDLLAQWEAQAGNSLNELLAGLVVEGEGPYAVELEPLRTELQNRVAATQESLPGGLQGMNLVFEGTGAISDGWVYLPPWVCDHGIATDKRLYLRRVDGDWQVSSSAEAEVRLLLRLNVKCASC